VKKLLLISILAIGVASPASAATYYVVQSTKTQKCMVVLQKPSEKAKNKTFVLVGESAGYRTKTEATAAMGAINECKSS
jgi:hypothetical protein